MKGKRRNKKILFDLQNDGAAVYFGGKGLLHSRGRSK